MMKIDVLTLFPEMFGPVMNESIVKRAQERRVVSIRTVNIRDFSEDKHRKVDDRPYGGGPGMVLKAQPVYAALEKLLACDPIDPLRDRGFQKERRIILLSPQGKKLTQRRVRRLAREAHLVVISGHYEGFDERIRLLATDEISIGDYVLTGGELPAMVLIDAIVRLLPGALGDVDSSRDESFEETLLEYPHYTRPVEFRGMKVPEVLVSGRHADIAKWRKKEAARRTKERRPDLWRRYNR